MKLQSTGPRLFAAALVLLFAAFAAADARAQATTTTTNENIPFTGSTTNPCNGDLVNFSGTLHVTNTLTVDSSGGTHLKTHINYQDVSGTGTISGATYQVRTTSNEVINDADGPQSEATVISTVKLIAQGTVPNYFLRTVVHITVNANGETTSTVSEVSFDCRGQ